ncbi:hypothetical protein BA190_17290 [Labrys sp. WJW]|nr:hypothetical protein BA190_17290 [Labrys sp. WJW]
MRLLASVAAGAVLVSCASNMAATTSQTASGPLVASGLSQRDARFLALLPNARTNPAYARTVVDSPTKAPPGTIVVDAQRHLLYFTLPDGKAIRYVVSTGRNGFAWRGAVYVNHQAEWPDWNPPSEMRGRDPRMTKTVGGPENPLGARALYLYANGADTLYRIHGTNDPFSIGMPVSSGCIRMSNADIIDLASRVPNGTRVMVY